MSLHISNTKQEVAQDFSKFLIDFAQDRDKITVALSGGSTPKVIFDILAADFGNEVEWSKFYFFWGDERCVPPTDEQSNYKMTVDHLFSKIDIPERNIFRIQGENDPELEALRYSAVLEKELRLENEVPQFDLVILGMGDDGHTASIFPHEIELWDASESCAVATHPDSGQKRVTISGDVINNASAVAFLVTGKSKAEKIKTIFKKEEGYLQYPASLVAPVDGDLHWFMDREATEKM